MDAVFGRDVVVVGVQRRVLAPQFVAKASIKLQLNID